MRRTTVRIGKSGQNRRFSQGELANDGARDSSSEVGAPSFAVFSQKRCIAYNPSYLCLRGILERRIGRRPAGRAVGCAEAPQAGLPPRGLPSLTQTGGVAHPRWLPAPIWTGANRLVLPLLALHSLTGGRFVAHPLHDHLFFVGSALQHRPRRTDKRVRNSIQTESVGSSTLSRAAAQHRS